MKISKLIKELKSIKKEYKNISEQELFERLQESKMLKGIKRIQESCDHEWEIYKDQAARVTKKEWVEDKHFWRIYYANEFYDIGICIKCGKTERSQ